MLDDESRRMLSGVVVYKMLGLVSMRREEKKKKKTVKKKRTQMRRRVKKKVGCACERALVCRSVGRPFTVHLSLPFVAIKEKYLSRPSAERSEKMVKEQRAGQLHGSHSSDSKMVQRTAEQFASENRMMCKSHYILLSSAFVLILL